MDIQLARRIQDMRKFWVMGILLVLVALVNPFAAQDAASYAVITPENAPQVSEVISFGGDVFQIGWSADGRYLAMGSTSGLMRVLDSQDGWREVQLLEGHEGQVWNLAWAPDGYRLASAGLNDGRVRVWDAVAGERLADFAHNSAAYVAWSADGLLLASSGFDNTIRVWDVAAGSLLAEVGASGFETAPCVRWSPVGNQFAAAILLSENLDDTALRVWNADGTVAATLSGANLGLCPAWSPAGGRVAAVSLADTVNVWNVAAGEMVAALAGHTDRVFSVVWSPDGNQLATTSADDTVRVWDAASGAEVHTLALSGGGSALAWSPGGQLLAVDASDDFIRLWAPPSGVEPAIPGTHTGGIRNIEWSADGRFLASEGAADGFVRVWGVAE
jgi:WD40 repeat protein